MNIVTVNNLSKTFGGICAVSNVDMHLSDNELVGLIGPNGAGKTTLFNMFTGVYKPTNGTINISFNEKSICVNKLKPYQITQLGFSRTFQNIRLFKELSVLDNVKIAIHKSIKYNIFDSILRTKKFNHQEEKINQECLKLLEIFDLKQYADVKASNLPYGMQRKLEIARALATKPKVLFLDEPAAGMNPQETMELAELIKWVKEKFNLTILLIEHDMSLVMSLCERIYVLDYGSIIACGSPEEIKTNKRVIAAYLGEEV